MITLEPYQQGAVAWLSSRRKGLCCGPAGCGKTIIAAAALERVLTSKERHLTARIGWLCNTIEQAEQGAAAVAKMNIPKGLAEFLFRCAAANQDWSTFDALIVDECAHATAPQWAAQIATCPGALWGFTATPWSNDAVRDQALRDMFDNQIYVIPRSAVAASRLVAATVFVLTDTDEGLFQVIEDEFDRIIPARRRQMEYSGMPAFKVEATVRWQACMKHGIELNQARNWAVVRSVEQHQGQRVIVLVNNVEHAQKLARELAPRAVACHSKMPKAVRARAFDDFRAGRKTCIIATSLADEGLDLPMAEVLVLASGGRSKSKAEQRTGRVLRAFAGKTKAVIYDFADRQHPMMAKHAKERFKLYAELGYTIEYGNT